MFLLWFCFLIKVNKLESIGNQKQKEKLPIITPEDNQMSSLLAYFF